MFISLYVPVPNARLFAFLHVNILHSKFNNSSIAHIPHSPNTYIFTARVSALFSVIFGGNGDGHLSSVNAIPQCGTETRRFLNHNERVNRGITDAALAFHQNGIDVESLLHDDGSENYGLDVPVVRTHVVCHLLNQIAFRVSPPNENAQVKIYHVNRPHIFPNDPQNQVVIVNIGELYAATVAGEFYVLQHRNEALMDMWSYDCLQLANENFKKLRDIKRNTYRALIRTLRQPGFIAHPLREALMFHLKTMHIIVEIAYSMSERMSAQKAQVFTAAANYLSRVTLMTIDNLPIERLVRTLRFAVALWISYGIPFELKFLCLHAHYCAHNLVQSRNFVGTPTSQGLLNFLVNPGTFRSGSYFHEEEVLVFTPLPPQLANLDGRQISHFAVPAAIPVLERQPVHDQKGADRLDEVIHDQGNVLNGIFNPEIDGEDLGDAFVCKDMIMDADDMVTLDIVERDRLCINEII